MTDKVKTRYTGELVEIGDAVSLASSIRSMLRMASHAELLTIYAHNSQIDRGLATNGIGYIPVGEIDENILDDPRFYRHMPNKMHTKLNLEEETTYGTHVHTGGLVAVNMLCLNSDEFDRGRIVPITREPFEGIDILP